MLVKFKVIDLALTVLKHLTSAAHRPTDTIQYKQHLRHSYCHM